MKKSAKINGRLVRIDLSSHCEERAKERGVTFDAIAHVLQHGAVIMSGFRPVQAFKLAEGLGPFDRFGPFARFSSVFASPEVAENAQGLLVSWSIRGHKHPLHVDTRIVDGEIVVTTVYFADDLTKWHPSGLATNASWGRHGQTIVSSMKEWSAFIAASRLPVAS